MFSSNKALREGASGYSDPSRGMQAFESTKQLASQALEKAGDTVRDLRSGAGDIARRSVNTMSDARVAAQRQLGQYAQATGRYVSEQPVKSALIAAAVGAAVAALILAMRRNRHGGYY